MKIIELIWHDFCICQYEFSGKLMEPLTPLNFHLRNDSPAPSGFHQHEQPPIKSERTLGPEENQFKPFGEDGLSFKDILDIINPLHHIPIVNSIYRQISGDQIEAIPRIAGGSLFFGPLGLAGATLNVIVENLTGKDIDSHLSGLFSHDPQKTVKTQKFRNDGDMYIAQASKKPITKDPITSWAEREVSFRRQLAVKKGLNARINEGEEPINYISSAIKKNTKEVAELGSSFPYLKTQLTVKKHKINFSI